MIRQIKYFQTVVRLKSFTDAAEECWISQSAISQQIQALEKELGVKLLNREKRKFSLTPAGEYFYKKSLKLTRDYDRLFQETQALAGGASHEITVGFLKSYQGAELMLAVAAFKESHPETTIRIISGSHEELYEQLRSGRADIVLNDLRRVPSDRYVNEPLAEEKVYAAISSAHPLAGKETLDVEELKNIHCIVIAPEQDAESETLFYREYFGIKSEILLAGSLEEAHLMVVSGRGYLLSDRKDGPKESAVTKEIPLCREGEELTRMYYAFRPAGEDNQVLEDFAKELKEQFEG